MYKALQTMCLCPLPVLKLLRGHSAIGGLSCGMHGLGNELTCKDETNLNSFKSALTLSGNGWTERVAIVLILWS